MGKFLKSGKVVIMLQGRYAGKKAVIVKQYDDGHGERHYGHCIVAGIARYPLKVNKAMGKKRLDKRSKVKPFLKVVNYNHVMPTRYALADLDQPLKAAVKDEAVSGQNTTARKEAGKAVQKLFTERYTSGKNAWFFSKLRF